MSADPITDLLTGLAELLEAQGVGDWNPTGAATGEGTPAIALRSTPPAAARSITLIEYSTERSARLTDTLVAVNVRCRGDRDPSTAAGMAQQVFLALHALGPTQLGTAPNLIKISDVCWQSETQIGPDQNGRYDRSVNYYARLNIAHPRLS